MKEKRMRTKTRTRTFLRGRISGNPRLIMNLIIERHIQSTGCR
jgi:hypothetical protein